MNKNLMLFIWFLKLGLLKPRDEYNLHDYIRKSFCPEHFPPEELDEKEQLLRDTPGPTGIKYAAYIGNKVNGMPGAVFAVIALFIPIIVIASAIWFVYANFLTVGRVGQFSYNAFAGMHAVTAGLIVAHLYKIVYFNKTSRKSLVVIVFTALIFIFVNAAVSESDFSIVLMPFYVVIVIALGIVCGIVHAGAAKRAAANPNKKYIDPRSRKGKRLLARQLEEEEYALRKYIDDDTIKKRRQQLEEEAEKNRKRKGE